MDRRGAGLAALLLMGCHSPAQPVAPVVAPAAKPASTVAPVIPANPAANPVTETASRPGDRPLSPAEIAARATASVVLIRTPLGLGSGFVVSPDGRIATNLHVIRGASEATITLADGRIYSELQVMGADAAHDLVLLRVRQEGLAALPLGDSGAVKPGERVVAIGHPLGLGNTVSDGLVSAVRVVDDGLTLLQISAPISEGSSGGPLLDERGRVIGVSTLVITRGQNLNFGIPIAYLARLLQEKVGEPLPVFASKSRRTRAVPRHPLDLLAGCTPAQLSSITDAIERAIHLGAPLYNQGNIDACFRIYQGAAVELQERLEGCAGPRKALADGVRRAAELPAVDAKAWALRDAFDGLIDVIDRAGRGVRPGNGGAGSAERDAPRRRDIPHHPITLLKDCGVESRRKLLGAIGHAIDLGAPLYNEGQREACYRIYEDAVLSLQRDLPACTGVKRALGVGLKRARSLEEFEERAWALRDTFDGLIEVVERVGEK